MRQDLRMHLQGLLWLAGAAAVLAGLFSLGAVAVSRSETLFGVALAWALTAPFFLAASGLLRSPGPWFEGVYAAGFLARLLALGIVMAVSASRGLPAVLALSLFGLELAGLFWVARRLPRRAAC